MESQNQRQDIIWMYPMNKYTQSELHCLFVKSAKQLPTSSIFDVLLYAGIFS